MSLFPAPDPWVRAFTQILMRVGVPLAFLFALLQHGTSPQQTAQRFAYALLVTVGSLGLSFLIVRDYLGKWDRDDDDDDEE